MTRTLAAFAFALCLTASANDWPNWRGPNYNGVSSETGWNTKWPAEGPKRLWKASVGTGFSSMSVVGDHVFTMGNTADQDTVYCFDANTGKTVWKQSYKCALDPKYYEGGPSVTPTIAENRVFTLSRKGDVYCFDAENGKVLWNTNLNKGLGAEIPTWGFAGSVYHEKGRLYLDVGAAGTCLDAKDGHVIWKSGTEASGYSTPQPATFDGKEALVIMVKKSAVAVDKNDGHKFWEYPWETMYDVNAAQPIIDGDKVFISSGYNHGCALLNVKNNKPEKVWENKNLKNHINSSVLLDQFLYGFDGDANHGSGFVCLNMSSGDVKWKNEQYKTGSLMVANHKLIILSDKGELILAEVSPDGFKPIAQAQVLGGRCWTQPVLANGHIYCRNAKGDLVCLDVKGT
jgi:outer membrane protein assembly factor BamB